MELSEKDRTRLAKLKWALYIPAQDRECMEQILEALQNAGHTTTPATHPWQGKELPMLDLSFEAAELVYDMFHHSRLQHTLLRRENCRGWLAYFGKSAKPKPRGNNDDLFGIKRRQKTWGYLA